MSTEETFYQENMNAHVSNQEYLAAAKSKRGANKAEKNIFS